jgi:hypothetical protein
MKHLAMGWRRYWMAIVAVFPVFAATPTAATSPPNPQRPMNPATCQEALARVQEAAEGSPLISSEENQKILGQAIERARQVCLARPCK